MNIDVYKFTYRTQKQCEIRDSCFDIEKHISRYGWIPDMSDIPEDVRDTYDWVPDTSITSMEILHGAYR